MLLEIDHRETAGGTVVVTLSGKLMLGPESQQVETLVSELLEHGRRDFIIDLAGITRIDSTGIGRLIFCFNKIAEAGGRLLMAGAQGYLRESFRVSRLDTVFRFYPDVETAAGKLQAG
ncbi:MAG TPA: STAS domain-containing protein [Bryobacteraceae bacterium]|nr:STAS domain-containing protein [Bryobacteraceae bacterium]